MSVQSHWLYGGRYRWGLISHQHRYQTSSSNTNPDIDFISHNAFEKEPSSDTPILIRIWVRMMLIWSTAVVELKMVVEIGWNTTWIHDIVEPPVPFQGRIQDFKLGRGRGHFLGYFVWKITILRKKIIFFPILGGGGAGCPPLESAPAFIGLCRTLKYQ